MLDFLYRHPEYILFVCVNILIIYLIFRLVFGKNDDDEDDDQGGIQNQNGPDLDLPPGVSSPKDPQLEEA